MDGVWPIVSATPDEIAAISSNEPLVAALAYAQAGLPVFPLHTPDGAGGCSCRRDCGRDAGKHPRTRHGLRDATIDVAQIHGWWTRFPDANVGIATGASSGLLVLDVDAGPGDETIARLEAAHGDLPPTWGVATGGGGTHLWYRHPGGTMPNSVGKLGPGVDVRADGGFVVVPPPATAPGSPTTGARGGIPPRCPWPTHQSGSWTRSGQAHRPAT